MHSAQSVDLSYVIKQVLITLCLFKIRLTFLHQEEYSQCILRKLDYSMLIAKCQSLCRLMSLSCGILWYIIRNLVYLWSSRFKCILRVKYHLAWVYIYLQVFSFLCSPSLCNYLMYEHKAWISCECTWFNKCTEKDAALRERPFGIYGGGAENFLGIFIFWHSGETKFKKKK